MIRRSRVTLAALSLSAVAVVGAPREPLEVTYLANEGFLLEAGGRRVLVDGLFGEGIAGYPAAPADERRRLEAGERPWQNIDLALATHHHGDHFDPQSVASFLAAHPEARFLSTEQAIERLHGVLAASDARLERARAVVPGEGEVEVVRAGGVTVELLLLHHGREQPIQNLGFVIELGAFRVLHVGDTEAVWSDFAPYAKRLEEIDVALVPVWFLTVGQHSAVLERIAPRTIIAMHLPAPDAPPDYFWPDRSYREHLQRLQRVPGVRVLTRTGETLCLDASGEPALRSCS